jgi:glycosyltransferase involved in cell wall biosynthesis
LTGDVPLVSVVVSTYQGEDHICEALDSILTQTLEELELIVVDDGSTDSTPDILASYDDPRMRVLRNAENAGVSRSVNRGFLEARGRFVARQDDDDVSEPDRLSRQLNFLETHPSVGLVASSYRVIDGRGNVLHERRTPTEGIDLRWRLLYVNAFANSSVMFRRELLDTVGMFRDGFPFAQDYDLWSRIARSTDVAALADPLVRYRRAGPSVTSIYGASADDVDRISRDNMRRLGPKASPIAGRIDREAGWRLLFADGHDLRLRRAARVVPDIFRLHKLFLRSEGISGPARLAQRARVVRQLAKSFRQLVKARGPA